MKSVLFVCSANICRSPMAMGLFQAHVAESVESWRVESAGVWALVDYAAATNTRAVLARRGVDLSAHRARQITVQMIEQFYLVLVMERNHKEALQAAFPQLAGRIYLLTEMVGRSTDILDPMGGEVDEFENTAREIEDLIQRGFKRIQRLAAGEAGSAKAGEPGL
jgi:protein-tyrosine phosphatase